MSDFKYSADSINQIIENNKLNQVCMQGVYRDLQKLKPVIEKIYDDYIFYLNYWENDAPYHGWLWDEDDGRLENQAKITDEITEKFKEIYALILAGLGERCENNDSDETCQSEAIKEFAERLKSSIYINTDLLVYQCGEVESVIDDVVKEMVGETE